MDPGPGEFAASLELFEAGLSARRKPRGSVWPYTRAQFYWQAEMCGLSYARWPWAIGEAHRWVEQSAALYRTSGSRSAGARAMRQLARVFFRTGHYESPRRWDEIPCASLGPSAISSRPWNLCAERPVQRWGMPSRARAYARQHVRIAKVESPAAGRRSGVEPGAGGACPGQRG
jgi:hypothetical protein